MRKFTVETKPHPGLASQAAPAAAQEAEFDGQQRRDVFIPWVTRGLLPGNNGKSSPWGSVTHRLPVRSVVCTLPEWPSSKCPRSTGLSLRPCQERASGVAQGLGTAPGAPWGACVRTSLPGYLRNELLFVQTLLPSCGPNFSSRCHSPGRDIKLLQDLKWILPLWREFWFCYFFCNPEHA